MSSVFHHNFLLYQAFHVFQLSKYFHRVYDISEALIKKKKNRNFLIQLWSIFFLQILAMIVISLNNKEKPHSWTVFGKPICLLCWHNRPNFVGPGLRCHCFCPSTLNIPLQSEFFFVLRCIRRYVSSPMKINERFNPLLPIAAYMQRSAKILISIQEEIIKNFESIFAYDSKNEKKERILFRQWRVKIL